MIKIILILAHVAYAFDSKSKSKDIDYEPKNCAQTDLIIPDLVGNPLEVKKGEYCFDSNFTALVSKNCQKDCELKKQAEKFEGTLPYSDKGTPGAWLCIALKGESLGAFLLHKGEKHIFHICKLKDEIISSDYLTTFRKK